MVQVRVNEGLLEGEVVDSEFGGSYCSFKGIPYAEPPLGELRFKAPKPLSPWEGIRSAKEHGPSCYQYDFFFQKKTLGNEDCLYLNVYTPDLSPTKPFPVMFWIHGGGFLSGSGDDSVYGPEFLIRQGVILVTINYRLEALGFLCLDTEDIPGNAGMKDQVAALRWVKNNISHFGGDPDNVTIFGESAGGVSVTYHLISPMSKGLFKRAISQSGTALSYWATTFEHRERAIAIARKLGLDSEDDKELYEFFKALPYDSLANVQTPITLAENGAGCVEVQLCIVNEKDFGNERFFYGEVIDVLRNGIHEGVEVIAGYCEHEGIFALGAAEFTKFLNLFEVFHESFVPKQIALNYSVKEQLKLGRHIKKFYFGNENVSPANLHKLIKFCGTDMFVFPIILWQRISASKNTVYLYKFTSKSERNFLTHLLGPSNELKEIIGSNIVVCHADDLPYIFPVKIANQIIDQESETFNMIDRVTKLWTNFAKHGIPTPDDSLGARWAPYTLEQEDYLDIGQQLVAATAPEKEEYKFWEDIFKKYLPQLVEY